MSCKCCKRKEEVLWLFRKEEEIHLDCGDIKEVGLQWEL